MSAQTNDHDSDIQFGQWLRDQRTRLGLTVEQASEKAQLSADRLKALELGYAEKGITKPEATRVCAAYKLPLQDFLQRAAGDDEADD